jgi:hypothetical protein
MAASAPTLSMSISMSSPVSLPSPVSAFPPPPPPSHLEELRIRTPPDEHEHSDADILDHFPDTDTDTHAEAITFFGEGGGVRDSPLTATTMDDGLQTPPRMDMITRAERLFTTIQENGSAMSFVHTPYQLYFRDPLRKTLFPVKADGKYDYPLIGRAWKHHHRTHSFHYHIEYLKSLMNCSIELIADMTERLHLFVEESEPFPQYLRSRRCLAYLYDTTQGLFTLEPEHPIYGKNRIRIIQVPMKECDTPVYHCGFAIKIRGIDIKFMRLKTTHELVIYDMFSKTAWVIMILPKAVKAVHGCGMPDCDLYMKKNQILKLVEGHCPYYPYTMSPGHFMEFLP